MLAYWPEFLIFATAHIMSLISPGPDFLMVVQSSLRYQRKTALLVALGISLGELIHVSYSLLGIGFIINKSLLLFNILKLIGSLYLIYLGIRAIKVNKEMITTIDIIKYNKTRNLSLLKAVGRGFFTNVLNIKAGFFTLSFFTVLVSPNTPITIQICYGIFVIISTLLWFILVAIFLTHHHIQSRFLGIKHWLERICGVILIGLGIKLAMFFEH